MGHVDKEKVGLTWWSCSRDLYKCILWTHLRVRKKICLLKDLVVQQTGFHLRFSMRKTRFNSQQNWLNPSWLREILRLTRVTAHTGDIFPFFYCVVPNPLWSKWVYMWPQEVRGCPFNSWKCSAQLVAGEQLWPVGTDHSFCSLHKTSLGRIL